MCVCMSMCVYRGQRLMLGLFFRCSLSYILRWDLSLNLKLPVLPKQAILWALEDLSLLLHHSWCCGDIDIRCSTQLLWDCWVSELRCPCLHGKHLTNQNALPRLLITLSKGCLGTVLWRLQRQGNDCRSCCQYGLDRMSRGCRGHTEGEETMLTDRLQTMCVGVRLGERKESYKHHCFHSASLRRWWSHFLRREC